MLVHAAIEKSNEPRKPEQARFDEDDLQYTRDWLRSRASTIEGGSSEIQKNIVSKRVLGLPEGKK